MPMRRGEEERRYTPSHPHTLTTVTHPLQARGGGGGGGASRSAGSMASLSGGGDLVYMEYKSRPPQHPLFKLRQARPK